MRREIAQADGHSKMNYLEFVRGVMALPNVDVSQKIAIINSNNPMKVAVNLPVASLIDMNPVGIDTATLKMSMDVSAATVSEDSLDASSEGEGSATFGWGLLKGSVRMKASVAKHSSTKRSSDYRATCDTELTMKRQPVPETLQRVIDMFAEVTDEAMAINRQIIAKQVEAATTEAEADPGLIAATDDYKQAA